MTEAACPTCGHDAARRSVIASLLRLPAVCGAHDDGNESGWPGECGCRHPFHAELVAVSRGA